MIRVGAKLLRAARALPTAFSLCEPNFLPLKSSPPIRLFSENNGFNPNPVALQMIDYALSLARSDKTDVSYGQGLLVLEQCQSNQADDNSKGLVLLGMSTLLSESGKFEEAIEKLRQIQDLKVSSVAVKVAASEALVGLHLELVQDDTSSMLADLCLQFLKTVELEIDNEYGIWDARVKALKGLVEFVNGNLDLADSYFQGVQENSGCVGNVALSYGEFFHAQLKFPTAKALYEKVIHWGTENKDFSDPYSLAAGNMVTEQVHLAATCSLGQLEAHLGNFADAEDMLTQALTRTEEHFGQRHPKVGVVLTCIALMFRHKATIEHSSSLLIQEGLYRKALEVLKAPPLETDGVEVKVQKRDMVALARGGYAELLCVQQNRKAEGERMKKWAETAWGNCRLSLAEALDISEPNSKVPVVDLRVSRPL